MKPSRPTMRNAGRVAYRLVHDGETINTTFYTKTETHATGEGRLLAERIAVAIDIEGRSSSTRYGKINIKIGMISILDTLKKIATYRYKILSEKAPPCLIVVCVT